MRIIQIVRGLAYGDAVGNDALALHHILKKYDPETRIYALAVDKRYEGSDFCALLDTSMDISPCDIILYHMATCSAIIRDFLLNVPGRKFMVYHNLTPPLYFRGYNPVAEVAMYEAYADLEALRQVFEGCIADSEFNRRDLLRLGYDMPIAVLPIIVPFDDYAKPPSMKILQQYQSDGWTNFIFVGRVVMNKCQEDVIRAFAYYNKYINPCSRLFVVGNPAGQEIYFKKLQRYIEYLQADNVIFTGHVPFDDILAYYKLADVFLCMSEHEGFCVPLLEAMYFDVPIVAYDAGAIKETLRGAGVLSHVKDPEKLAFIIDRLVTDSGLREEVLSRQRQCLQYFSYGNVSAMADGCLKGIMEQCRLSVDSPETVDEDVGEKVAEVLRASQKVNSSIELPAWEDIPHEYGARYWCIRMLLCWYRLAHIIAPVSIERLKVWLRYKLL